ncbi:MAG: hypothetical protein WCB27_16320 [Thermoguttaceae bacterium]
MSHRSRPSPQPAAVPAHSPAVLPRWHRPLLAAVIAMEAAWIVVLAVLAIVR